MTIYLFGRFPENETVALYIVDLVRFPLYPPGKNHRISGLAMFLALHKALYELTIILSNVRCSLKCFSIPHDIEGFVHCPGLGQLNVRRPVARVLECERAASEETVLTDV
jgi:hypothetical protein